MACEEDIHQLVESGFDINSKDVSGVTLLHKFTKEGDLVGVKSLLEHEADFNVVDNENRNPLHYAIMHGHKKIAKLLVNQLTINSRDKNGFTIRLRSSSLYALLLLRFVQTASISSIKTMQGAFSLAFAKRSFM